MLGQSIVRRVFALMPLPYLLTRSLLRSTTLSTAGRKEGKEMYTFKTFGILHSPFPIQNIPQSAFRLPNSKHSDFRIPPYTPEYINIPKPPINKTNMAAIKPPVFAPLPLNSFHIKTPHRAATIVAPWPRPYDMAGPAFPAAIRLNELPIPHITPPSMPVRCSLNLPLNNDA